MEHFWEDSLSTLLKFSTIQKKAAKITTFLSPANLETNAKKKGKHLNSVSYNMIHFHEIACSELLCFFNTGKADIGEACVNQHCNPNIKSKAYQTSIRKSASEGLAFIHFEIRPVI